MEVQTSADGGPQYSNVPRGNGTASWWFYNSFLTPLSEEDTADSKEKKPCAVNLELHEDGDAVSIAASLFFEACDPDHSLEWRQKHPGQAIRKYSMHLNETVALDEMKQFGLQPYTLKIVNAQIPNPAGPPPSAKCRRFNSV